MEKLGIERKQLVEELQGEYGRLRQQEHELQKTGAPAPRRAQIQSEIDQIKSQLNRLQSDAE